MSILFVVGTYTSMTQLVIFGYETRYLLFPEPNNLVFDISRIFINEYWSTETLRGETKAKQWSTEAVDQNQRYQQYLKTKVYN